MAQHNIMGIDPCDGQDDEIFNATTQKRNWVDPRTGLFEACIPLPSVTGNAGNGPVIDMSMFYTPVVNNVFALGDGGSFAFTVYNLRTQKLALHSGEVIGIQEGKNFDSPVLSVVWGRDTMHLTHRNGRTETLKPVYGVGWDAELLYLSDTLTMDGYNFLSFEWSVTRRKLDTVTTPEGGEAVTRLSYDDHYYCGWLLAGITTFEGVGETVY